MNRQSGSSKIYTLEEFKELTGCEYKTTHKGYLNGLYCATVVFENVDESFSGKYLVGYTMKNTLGSVTVIDPADMVPFTLVEPRPVIQTFIESQSCYEGGRMTFSFSADDMDYAEWIFEKPDEEGVAVAYDMEEMKELFPDVTFETSLSDNVATLKISNAQTELSEYMLYAYGGLAAESCAGSAEMRVIVRPEGSGVTVNCIGDIDHSVSGQVVTVNHKLACKVGYLSGGSYVAITAVANGDGTYSFTAPAGVTEVLLVVKGDANGDANVNIVDKMTVAKSLLLTTHPAYQALNSIQAFACNMDNVPAVNMVDKMTIAKSLLLPTHPAYQAIKW